MRRRDFVAGTVMTGAALAVDRALGAPRAIPIIDCHVHQFDSRRPQGAPYAGSRDFKGGVALPGMYRALARPLGIAGAIVIEASPWIEDNLWALETAQTDTMMLGVIGNLMPEKPEFPEYLARYAKNRLFRGIRYGNIWNYDLTRAVDDPAFVAGIKLLAQADLTLDTANPRIDLLQAIVKLTDRAPDLRVVIDHLPALEPAAENRAAYDAVLNELRARPRVYAKLSSIIHRANGAVATDLAAHRERLDMLVDCFGEDRVLFGSDWPNSVGVATLPQIVSLARDYFASRPRAVAEKYFWRNSRAAYGWARRDATQPG